MRSLIVALAFSMGMVGCTSGGKDPREAVEEKASKVKKDAKAGVEAGSADLSDEVSKDKEKACHKIKDEKKKSACMKKAGHSSGKDKEAKDGV